MSTPSATTYPTVFTLDTSLLRWHLKVDSLWQLTPRKTHVRKLADGTQKIIARRGQREVCDGAKYTGEILIKRARKQVQRMLNSSLLFNTLVTDTGVVMPSVLVNAHELNEKRSLTPRTMRSHLAQLQKVGLITRKKWHGTNASFELWINPDFIWETAQNGVEKQATADSGAQPIARQLSPNGNKFPHTEVLVHQETLKETISGVDKMSSDDFSERPSLETEGDNQGADAGQASKAGTGGRGAAQTSPSTSEAEVAATAAQQAQNKAYVVSAWHYAKALLYADRNFSPEEERKAQIAIWNGVYGGFPAGFANWDRYHAGVLRRLELVQDFLIQRRNKGKKSYVPLPYADIKVGCGYFDWENAQGFRGTLPWLENDRRAKYREAVNVAVGKACGELKLRRLLDKGEEPKYHGRRRKIPLHIENSTLRELFHSHETSLHRLGGREAVEKFYLKYSELR